MLVRKIDFEVRITHKESGNVSRMSSDKVYEMLLKYNLRNVDVLIARVEDMRDNGKLIDGDGLGMSKLTFERV